MASFATLLTRSIRPALAARALALGVAMGAAFPLLTLAVPARAAALNGEPRRESASLDWQRITFEERLLERVNRSIAAAAKPGLFVASLTVKLLPPPPAPPAAKPSERPPAQPDATDPDRLLLDKLDMDYAQFAPVAEPSGADTAPARGLLESIDQISVSVLVDESVPEDKKEVIGKIVRGAVGPLGKNPVAIQIEKAKLVTPPPAPSPSLKAEPPKEKEWDLKRWLIEFKVPAAIVGGTLVLSLFFSLTSLMLGTGFRRIEARKVALAETREAREAAAAAAVAEKASSEASGAFTAVAEAPPGATRGLEIEDAQKGMDRFRALIGENLDAAVALVRVWTKAGTPATAAGLALLSQVLTADELSAIMPRLTQADRTEWKRALAGLPPSWDPAAADAFVASQVIDSILVPAPKTSKELRDTLAGLGLAESVGLAADNPRTGALLANVLPAAQMSRMFAMLSPEQANLVTREGLRMSADEVEAGMADLPRALEGLQSKGQSSPFADRVAEMLQEVSPTKEQAIFAALSEAKEYALLEATARRYLPSELLFKLPAALLKPLLERMPMAKRAELLTCLDESSREMLLAALGAPGSKARDLIDLELQEVGADEVRRKRAEKNQEKLFRQFLDSARGVLRASEAASEQAEGVLLAWLNEKTGARSGGSGAAA